MTALIGSLLIAVAIVLIGLARVRSGTRLLVAGLLVLFVLPIALGIAAAEAERIDLRAVASMLGGLAAVALLAIGGLAASRWQRRPGGERPTSKKRRLERPL